MKNWLNSLLFPFRGANVTWKTVDDRWYTDLIPRAVASGVKVDDNTAMTYSAVWACTRLFSATVASLPLNLYRRTNGKTEVATDDPRCAMVHSSPNHAISSFVWRSWGMSHQMNAGNAFAEIVRNHGAVVGIWPIDSSRVKVHVWTEQKRKDLLNVVKPRIMDEMDGVPFYIVANASGPPTPLPASQMLHVPSIMIDSDGVSGKGVIRNARESIGIGIATERYGANYFGANGVPRIVITQTPNVVDFEAGAREQFREDWDKIHGGPDGRKMALLPAGMGVVPLPVTAEDSQFLTTRQHNIEEICRWYGAPPHMIQHLVRATYSNAEFGQIEFVKFSLVPWLVLWEHELNRKLLRPEERETLYFKFSVDGLMRGDSTAQANYFGKMINASVMNPNEVRELLDMNPYEGGDRFYIQGAMVPIEMAGMFTKQSGAGQTDNANDDQASARVLEAAKSLARGISERFATKAGKAMETASRHPKEFLDRVEGFYTNHRTLYETALNEFAGLWESVGVERGRCLEMVEQHCQQQKQAMLDIAGTATANTLEYLVGECVAQWQTEVPTRDVEFLMGGRNA